MSILLILFMYAVWSSVFSLGKMALEVSPPLFLTAARMLLAGVLLLGFLALRNRPALSLSLKQLSLICLLALFGMYLTNACEFWSLQHLTVAKTCFIYSLCPFFSAFFSYLHFGERMTPRKWAGLFIGFGGIIPVLAQQKGSEELISTIPFLSWPELAMIGAAICTVYGWILMRVILKEKNHSTSPLTVNGTAMLIGGLMALGHSLLAEPWHPIPVAAASLGSFTQGILLMTLISNILCYNLYGFLLKRFTATFISFMGLLSPIFASLSSWALLGETLSPVIFLSTAVVSIGAWLVHSEELRQGYILQTERA
ncbi:MAG: DMT family transporter [Chlamydiia bacterium]|nr:DMT family transporter [Chlamydiia bacterium]